MQKILLVGKHTAGFKKEWKEAGYECHECCDELTGEISQKNKDIIKNKAGKNDIQYVFSFDYMPGVAEVCAELELIYICWVWDSPHNTLFHKSSHYDTNLIFLFDYEQYQFYLERGYRNVFYLPLAPDIDEFQRVIEEDHDLSRNKYGEDVVFLGNLYNDENQGLYDRIQYLPPYVRGYLDSLMLAQKLLWGTNIIKSSVSDRIWSELRKYVNWDIGENYEEGVYEQILCDMIAKKVSQTERIEMCNYLADHFNFALYTGADSSFNPQIRNKGYAIYNTEMPLIFRYSKININITIRSIVSGVPLRVMDVLACGGFLLTNYQPEITEYFEDGKELVIYQDLQDLYDKVEYYLAHEEERAAIAQAGYEKVRKEFHYKKQISKIIDVLEG